MGKKLKIRLFILVMGFFLNTISLAKEPKKDAPFDFKGIALGSRQSKIEQDKRFTCWDPKHPIADRICRLHPREKETIAGSQVATLQLYYYDEKLQTITIFFNEENFYQVVAAFNEKYGPGTSRKEGIQSPLGAILENQIDTWQRLNATLEVKRYSANEGLGSVRFTSDDVVKGYEKRKAKLAKEKAKDL